MSGTVRGECNWWNQAWFGCGSVDGACCGGTQRVHETTEDGWTIQQAAFSYHPDVVIRSTSCFSHTIKVDGKASDGAWVEGDRSYTRRSCDSVVSRGTPVAVYRGDRYRMWSNNQLDWWQVRLDAPGVATIVTAEARHGVAKPTSPDYNLFTRYFVAGEPSIRREVTETGAGGVGFGAGGQAFGIGLSVGMWAQSSDDNTVTVELWPPDGNLHLYKVRFVAGGFPGNNLGLVGAGWNEY